MPQKRRDFIKNLTLSGGTLLSASPNFSSLSLKEKTQKEIVRKLSEDKPFWYNKPANDWKSAIPLGNGRIGGMIFGEVQNEQILLNENSIWCGPPIPEDNPEGPELIERMRKLLFGEKADEAEKICEEEFLDSDGGDAKRNRRSYELLGWLKFNHVFLKKDISDYKRVLDYETAVAKVSFKQDGVEYQRESFISFPDQVLVLRYSSNKSGKISFTVSMDRPQGAKVTVAGAHQLKITGQAFDKEGEHKGVSFDGLLDVRMEGGRVRPLGDKLEVSEANAVTILFTAATDYNFKDPPLPLSRYNLYECEEQIKSANQFGYEQLKSRHIKDYQNLYFRSALQLSLPTRSDIPIDQRITEAAAEGDDPQLLKIYYDYCRYILISASREGGLPMTLQGIWNPMIEAPWRSNWHLNINIEEAYWFAEQANLGECHEPLFSLVENLRRNGRKTARIMLGTKRGFMAAHRTDGWLHTAPSQHPRYGMYVLGAAWLCNQVMEHYRFTQDRNFLANRALPVLRSNVRFFLDWLVSDPKTGKLVSGPSTSPENAYRLPNGKVASISMGPSHDQEVIWNSFRDFLEVCQILGIENEETKEVREKWQNLALPKIGPDGRLQEWAENYEETEPGHRHLSHLWGIMPGNRITIEKTPLLAKAVSKSLDYRLSHQYDAQGWSLGWVTCIMVRLLEGDQALKLMDSEYFGKAFPNMFVNAHGQVQVGDMMGIPLAMIEMLLQSHTGEIVFLPALPKLWATGNAKGLCVRGGFVVDLAWENSMLKSATIYSKTNNIGIFKYKNKRVKVHLRKGEKYKFLI